MSGPGYSPVPTSEGGSPSWVKPVGCLACLGVTLAAVYYGALHVLTGMAVDGFLTIKDSQVEEYCGKDQNLNMANITENLWWPGCGLIKGKMEDFDKQCPKDDNGHQKCIKTSNMEEVDAFNTKYPGTLVKYKTRPHKAENGKDIEVVDLVGWWLPAPGHNKDTPRIVLQHGFTANSNKHRYMYFAFLLRKLGYSVLSNNLRDHCYSGDSKAHIVQWGHAYPFDTLGAWDYARTDPDGKLGGALSASKVGVAGMSMGGFITNNVFGLEGDVPGVWVDSPPFTPETGFAWGLKNTLAKMGAPGFIADIFASPVWAGVEAAGQAKGVDIMENLPEKNLPKGPDTKRPIFWSGNKDDDTVAFADGAMLAKVIKKYPKKYNLQTWEQAGDCNGGAHCEDHIRNPQEYLSKMCKFWKALFGTDGDCSQYEDNKTPIKLI